MAAGLAKGRCELSAGPEGANDGVETALETGGEGGATGFVAAGAGGAALTGSIENGNEKLKINM